MFLARVEGSVVATKKDEALSGRKLLLVRPQLVDENNPAQFRPGKNTIIAVDSVGAGEGELIMFTQGSSARLAPNMKSAPVVILRRVNKSFRIWTVNTLPAIKFPCNSSSRIVTVDSPVPDGSKLCQIILVELSKLGKVSVSLGEIMPSNVIDL